MENNLDFTIAMEDDSYSVVDNEDFLNKDAEAIYDYLCNKVKPIPFCDYLKRYIFQITIILVHIKNQLCAI